MIGIEYTTEYQRPTRTCMVPHSLLQQFSINMFCMKSVVIDVLGDDSVTDFTHPRGGLARHVEKPSGRHVYGGTATIALDLTTFTHNLSANLNSVKHM